MYAGLSDTAHHTGEQLGALQVAQAYEAPDWFFFPLPYTQVPLYMNSFFFPSPHTQMQLCGSGFFFPSPYTQVPLYSNGFFFLRRHMVLGRTA